MAKLIKKTDNITPFGGIFFVINNFNKVLSPMIDSVLGMRSRLVGYQYSDIFRALMCMRFCNGDTVEDVNVLKPHLTLAPHNEVPSSDTVLRGISELSTDNVTYEAKSGKSYDFNTAKKLNELLQKSLIAMGSLTPGEEYDVDFDHEYLKTEKYDAKFTYKKFKGYSPGVFTVGENIVYLENRDGNANVRFKQAESIERFCNMFVAMGLKVRSFRMDCGSYSKDIVRALLDHSRLFYVRAERSAGMTEEFAKHPDGWKDVEINFQKCQLQSFPFIQFEGMDHLRIVVQRTLRPNGEVDMFEGKYEYRSILTNDWDMEDEDVVRHYNKRGAQEKVFDVMDNDFGWKRLPKSFMNENTAFMLIMALIYNYFLFFRAKKEMRDFGIEQNARLKRLIFMFILVPAKWGKAGRGHSLTMYSKMPFEKIALADVS